MSALSQCAILVPAYDPDDTLPGLIAALRAEGFATVIVVNDGSRPEKASVFEACTSAGAEVIEHAVNRGKGAALKTGFARILQLGADGKLPSSHVVTVDADGQHLPADVKAVAMRALNLRRPSVVLGVRRFDADTPLRSRFGNTTTRLVFRSLTGQAISDTQTGLRALPFGLLPRLLEVPGDRYEFEMRMLSVLVQQQVPIIEQTIQTVYIESNASSHFRPVVDSIRIYAVLLKDLLLALASFGLDVALFSFALHLTHAVVLSTYLARSVSVVFNFLGNKYFVFRGSQTRSLGGQLVLYAIAAVVLATASGVLVKLLSTELHVAASLVKVFVDLGLYVTFYTIRKHFIFRLD